MILSILLGVAAVVAAVLFGLQGAEITTGVAEALVSPLSLAVERTFTLLGGLAPILVALVPIYLAFTRREGDDRTLAFAAVYGLALYAVAIYTGLDSLLLQEMRGSLVVGSTIGLAVSTLGTLGGWVAGILQGLVLWGAGLALVFLDAFLDAIVGIGEAARAGKRGVSAAKRGILGRLGA